MVTVPNSLSMNAVNLQKAKSLPQVIRKNISPNPVQVNKKIVKSSDMEKMLKDAQTQGVDPAEIVQDLLDKGYDIEDKKTWGQKAIQTTKNIVGGIAGGVPALGPKIGGAVMKGLGTPMFESYQKAQGVPTKPNILQRGGEELISRGEKMRGITEKAIGADPEAMSTQVSRMVVPLGASIIASGPLGLTKAGAGAFTTTKAGLAARSLQTIAKGLTKGALVGGAEQAMFDVAQQGKTSKDSVAIGAGFGAALPLAAPLVSGVGKFIGKNLISKPLNTLSNKLYTSGLLNPKKLEYVTDALRETGDQVDNVVNWMYERGVRGGKTKIVEQLDDLAKGTRAKVVNTVNSFDDMTQNGSIRGALEEIADAIGDPKSQKQVLKLNRINELIRKHDTTGLTWAEVQKVKEDMDEVLNIYTIAGDVRSGQKKVDLASLRQEIRKLIEDRGMQAGVDLQKLNRDTAVAKKLSEGINYKDKADWVREVLSPFASPFAGGAIGALQGDTMEERIRNAVVGAILGRVAQSTALKTNTGFYLKKFGDFFSKLPAKDKTTLALLVNKLDDLQNSTNSIDDIGGLHLASKSMLATASDSVPNSKGVVSKIQTFIDDATRPQAPLTTTKAPLEKSYGLPEGAFKGKTPKQVNQMKIEADLPSLAQSTKTATKLPVAKKTPLKQASDTPKLSPKTPKALKTPTPLSKVDDALPTAGKMEQKAKSLDSADLTKSIEKAKAEGKTFDEFVKEKANFIHETDTKFDKFDMSKIGGGQGDDWLGRGLYLQEKGTFKIEQYGKNKMNVALSPDAKIFVIKDTPKGKYRDNFVERAINNTDYGKYKLKTTLDDGLNPKSSIIPRDILWGKTEAVEKLKKMGYDGLLQDGELVIYNDKVLKTESQLRQMRDQTPTPALGKSLPKVDNTLLSEARKYKSADEFVKGLPSNTYITKIDTNKFKKGSKIIILNKEGELYNIMYFNKKGQSEFGKMEKLELEKIGVDERFFDLGNIGITKEGLRKIREEANKTK